MLFLAQIYTYFVLLLVLEVFYSYALKLQDVRYFPLLPPVTKLMN